MQGFAYSLIGFYALAEMLVEANIFKPANKRFLAMQHNFVLHGLDMLAKVAAVSALMILVFSYRFGPWLACVLALTLYTVGLKQLFLGLEVRRLRKRLPEQSARELRKHVRRRTSISYVP